MQVLREGTDVTVVGWGAQMLVLQRACDEVAKVRPHAKWIEGFDVREAVPTCQFACYRAGVLPCLVFVLEWWHDNFLNGGICLDFHYQRPRTWW